MITTGKSNCKRCGREFTPKKPDQIYGPTCARKLSGQIQLDSMALIRTLPKSRSAIAKARKLLDLFEEDIPKPELEKEIEKESLQEKAAKEILIEKPEIKLTKADLTIEKFPHDKTQERSYKTLFYLEMPDGRVVLRYMGGMVHTTKELALKLPYPTPKGYLKGSGFTPNQVTGIRTYREFLFTSKLSETAQVNPAFTPAPAPGGSTLDRIRKKAEQKKAAEKEPENTNEDPDRKFRKMLNTDTHISQDGGKIDGDLP